MLNHPALLFLLLFTGPCFAQLSTNDPQYYGSNGERFHEYVFRSYTDPVRMGWLLADSALDHWSRSPHGWDQSAESYSYRVASGWGRRIARNTVQLGFETLLREDSRYRPSLDRRFGKRIVFALSHSVLAYKPDGRVEPMYGLMAAGVVAAATSSTWHPQRIDSCTLLNGVGQAAMNRAGSNLLTEFQPDLKNFGRRTWNSLIRK